MKREKFKREHYEFAVIGGGMAGLCAAVAAARHGVKTVLIHNRPVLGGNASSEIRIHICGADENGHKPHLTEGGILHEILLKNKSRNDHFSYALWDLTLYETIKAEQNLTVYFNTSMIDCSVEDDRITSVLCFQTTTEYRLEIEADLFADCTGNGTLGYFAGAEYREGSESFAEFREKHAPQAPNNERMGNTVLFKAVRKDHPVSYTPPAFAKPLTEEQLKYRLHSKFHTVDASSAEDPDAFTRASTGSNTSVDYGYWWIKLMGEGDDFVGQYEDIKDDLLAYVYGMWDHIKNGGEHGAANYELDWVGALPGMRESRRLVGDYLLNENDVFENRTFEDAVAYGGWPVDVHCAHGLLDFHILPSEVYAFKGAYAIPWRCYYSKNIKNLMMAGKIISTTRLALGSTRIMGTCAIGGQAVGTAVSLMKKYGCLPRELSPHIEELQQLLLRDDGFIPTVYNADPDDLALQAAVSASSAKAGYEAEHAVNGISRPTETEENAWHSDGISPNGEWLSLCWEQPKTVAQLQLTFDSGFGHPIRITMSDNRRKQQRIGVPPEIVKDFTVELLRHGQTVATHTVTDNIRRLCRIDFAPTECDTVRVLFHATHGCGEFRVFEIRAYEKERALE
ncbi:MAG: FAD-dependent oxidoreductase [Clostridia bacterium]|nr:FAD-dependent oxidoreductase [Clostridia bacterium]